jgi:ligand-binding sensor domain-containing protein/anti-sigma regulatory factor (Ser/Thr protein kinase)
MSAVTMLYLHSVENRRAQVIRAMGLLLLLALSWTPQRLGAATNYVTRYDLRVWQTDEGLPQNSVHAIAQTPDGYLWVGTREGVARFDGVRFTQLDLPAAGHVKHAFINALVVDRDGGLWIASETNGLTRIKGNTVARYSKADGLPDNQVQCLLESQDGSLWVGCETGLARFQNGRFTNFNAHEAFLNNSVKDLHEETDGILRVATVTGLVSVNRDNFVSTNNFGLGAIPGILKSVQTDQQGRLWLGDLDGLICLTDGKPDKFAANTTLTEKITTVIHEDSNGQIWVGTYGGLTRRVGGQLKPWLSNEPEMDDLVHTIFEDREGTLWVGGRDGLYRLTPTRERFMTLTKQDGLNGNNVVSVLEDQSGAMWFGIWGGGVTRYLPDENSFTVVTATNGLTHDRVLSLLETKDGSIWVGMDMVGVLNRLRTGLVNDFPRQTNLLNALVRVMYEGPEGELWVGTGKGLNVLRAGRVETYTVTNGLAGNDVTAICKGIGDQLWIGTDNGLSRWTGARFVNLTTRDGLSHNHINALYSDAGGVLWVGTKGGGLNRIHRDGRISRYTVRDGLFNDEVFEILEDNSGHLWMSCRRGIFRVSRQQLDGFDAKQITRLTCTVFGREDGLATVQCNGVAKPAGWKSRDGRLWFATIRGVVAVADNVKLNDQPPEVRIEEAILDGKKLPMESGDAATVPWVNIPPGRGRLELHYTALSLQAAEKNRFKYQLEGVDSDWVDAGSQRAVGYPNLGPGRYLFRVIASNNDGVWNETGAQLLLRVAPHFWQTWWFRTMLLLGPLLLAVLFYRARVARLRELENLRIRIAADLHDDVGSRLTKVAMVTELAERETPEGSPGKTHIHNITRTVRDITRAMDEIVWTINPRNDTLENLANYIFHYAQEYFQDTGVRCRLDLPSVLPERRISTEERHNLFMAVKEALNNILKHAAATEVRIALQITDEALDIVVMDDGHGMASGNLDPTGEGMANMRQRLDKIGGEFKLRSRANGTTITLRLPGKWTA